MRQWTCVLMTGIVFAASQACAQATHAPQLQVPAPELKPLPDEPVPQAGDSLYAPVAEGRGHETLKTKIDSYLVATYGPRAVVSPMISAGIRMARPNYNYPPSWRDGMDGFARNYGSSLGTKAATQTARFAASALLHEDFRYHPSDSRNFFSRVGHAVGYTFVDRSDSGAPRLAVANFAAAAAGGFVPNAWLPDGFNNAHNGGTRSLSKFGAFAAQNVTREFAPEIGKAFRTLHLPFPRLPLPAWWTSDLPVAHR